MKSSAMERDNIIEALNNSYPTWRIRMYWAMRSCCIVSEPMSTTRDTRTRSIYITRHSRMEGHRSDSYSRCYVNMILAARALHTVLSLTDPVVYLLMSCEIVQSRESFATFCALVWPFSSVTELMVPAMVAT
jgi:hypothetical protein